MSVQELGALHSRYFELSARFKAAWTFHQFLQGLEKIFPEGELGKHAADFQSVYGALKEASQILSSSVTERLQVQLDQIARQVEQLMKSLVAADSLIPPSLVRQFFERVKNYDEKILTQMVRFYLYTQVGQEWTPDRLDKVDFLLTKLSEQAQPGTGVFALGDRNRLREIFQSLWTLLADSTALESEVEKKKRAVEELRHEMSQVRGFGELQDRNLVRRYRELKHSFGNLLFEPDLLFTVVETNLAFKSAIRQFYRLEEQRIVAEYQRVFELESRVPVDMQLDQELTTFHQAIEEFERKQRRDNVKLDELTQLRRQADSILPRLVGAEGRESAGTPSSIETPVSAASGNPAAVAAPPATTSRAAVLSPLTSDDDLIGDHFRQLVNALEGTDREASPKAVSLTPELYAFRLEPREVVSYRRLFGSGDCDRSLEQFLIECAALRVRINEEAEEITGLLDETAVTRDAPVFGRARLTARLADAFVQRFSHFIDQAVQDGNFAEAQGLQLLRMRLIRDYSGLWLLVNRPTA